MRIGHGFDVHRFAENRDLILGGVKIPYEKGLAAHSDGDVVIHALCDALLGAAGLGDIGKHFPDNSEQYKNISSRILLCDVVKKLSEKGFRIANADVTVIAQQPKLAPHIAAMQVNLANDLDVSKDEINIKATTTEGLGFTGRGEGIATHAVVLIEKSP